MDNLVAEAETSRVTTHTSAFTKFYAESGSAWGGNSGPGSNVYHTIEYRSFVEKFVAMNGIKSVIDIGCGDWQFSRYLNYEGVKYYGFDVVPEVIERNRAEYGSENIIFSLLPDDLRNLPDAQLVVMKDVLQHLPNDEIFTYKRLVFDRYKISLITNSFEKANTPKNVDIKIGEFRCLDLTSPPYNFEGNYVLEFGSAVWERLRTLLCRGQG